MKRVLLAVTLVLLSISMFLDVSVASDRKARDGDDTGWQFARMVSRILDEYVPWNVEKSKIIYFNRGCVYSGYVDFRRIGIIVLYDGVVYTQDVADYVYYDQEGNYIGRNSYYRNLDYIITSNGQIIERSEIAAVVYY
ncbi:MAG: hypothetical protein HQK50_10980 [Oligoflexia bacterium]|nr:hypothetical protein [Oligoflexia bacterium]MBF0366086.1 hypothetical protein [Oligoflexia bacterium]